MAEFCRQCAETHFPDHPEFWNDGKEAYAGGHEANPNRLPIPCPEGYGLSFICEGCGFVLIDHEGRCLGGPGCVEGHGE